MQIVDEPKLAIWFVKAASTTILGWKRSVLISSRKWNKWNREFCLRRKFNLALEMVAEIHPWNRETAFGIVAIKNSLFRRRAIKSALWSLIKAIMVCTSKLKFFYNFFFLQNFFLLVNSSVFCWTLALYSAWTFLATSTRNSFDILIQIRRPKIKIRWPKSKRNWRNCSTRKSSSSLSPFRKRIPSSMVSNFS